MLGPFEARRTLASARSLRPAAKRAAALSLALLFLGVTAVSDASGESRYRETGPELGLDLGVTSFDDAAARDSGFRLSARGGWHFTDRFQLELQYADAESGEIDDHARLWSTFLNALVNFHPSDNVSPYLLFGAGRAKLEVGGRDKAGSAAQIGFGSRFSLPGDERFAGRVEATLLRESAFGLGDNLHLSVTGGISFRPGRRLLVGAIAGRVATGPADAGRPLAGVGVRLASAGSEIASTTSDAEGLFGFEELTEGSYRVALEVADLPADFWIDLGAAAVDVEVLAGQTAAVDFTAALREPVALSAAESAGVIAGRVGVDADGDGEAGAGETPLGGTEVLLSRAGERVAATRSGGDGGYGFERQPPGSYEVRIAAESLPARYRLGTGARALVVVPFEVGLIATESWGEVGGAVRVDENGDGKAAETERGLGGVGVRISSAGRRVGEAESGADGGFGLGRQSPGEYLVEILEATLPSGYRVGEGISSIEIRVPYSLGLLALARGDDVVGRIWVDEDDDGRRGRDERPLAGVGIDLAKGERSIGGAATDRTGGFLLGTEGPGRYAVSVVASSVPAGYRVGRGMSPRYVTVLERIAAGMSVAEGDGAISGELWADLDENAERGPNEPPIRDVEVELSREDQRLAAARSDGAGAFDLGPQEPGSYRLDVVESTLPAGYFLAPGASPQFVEVAERLGSIAVRVWLDADFDGQAQPGEEAIAGVEAQLLRGDRAVATGVTGADGGFTFEELEPGDYLVRITAEPDGRRYWVGTGMLPKRIALAPDQQAVAAFALQAQRSPFLLWPLWLLLLLLAVYALIHLLLRKRRYGRMLAPCWMPWPPGDRKKSAALLRELQEMKKPGARKTLEKLNSIRGRLGKLTCARPEVATELFLSYRGVRGWSEMYEMVEQMSPALAATALVLQQKAFALNRDGRGDEAEKILTELRAKEGPSPETNGILGRVYKDRWESAALDEAQLRKSLDTYLEGHRSDPSDPYPGINALTLMESFAEPPAERGRLLADVRRAVEGRKAKSEPDYWNSATRVELAVLSGDEGEARAALEAALAAPHDPWQPETTARNLKLIQAARRRHGRDVPAWLGEIIGRLEAAVPEG